jgi:hypothetical protein
MRRKIVTTFELDVPDDLLPEPSGEDIATYLSMLLQKSMDWGRWMLSAPTVYLEPPAIVIGVEGGVVQGGSFEVPASLVVLDYDTDSVSDDDGRRWVPQSGKEQMEEAYVGWHTLDDDPVWIKAVIDSLDDPECEVSN